MCNDAAVGGNDAGDAWSKLVELGSERGNRGVGRDDAAIGGDDTRMCSSRERASGTVFFFPGLCLTLRRKQDRYSDT